MLRNMLGSVFNFNLDQFLYLDLFCYFSFIFFVGGGGADAPIFIVFSAKMQNLKKHTKEKRHYL